MIFESLRGRLVGRDSSAIKHPIIGPWKEIMVRDKEKEFSTSAGQYSLQDYLLYY